MSYGEGDLHARVGELERENAELESLVRDMHAFIRPVLANPSGYFGCTNPAAAFAVLEGRMAALGIAEGDES